MKTLLKTSLATAVAAASIGNAQAATVVRTAVLGWTEEESKLPTSLGDEANFVRPYGSQVNGSSNRNIDDTTFTLDFGGGATAEFTITQTWDNALTPSESFRQFGSGIEGSSGPQGARPGDLIITLNSMSNISSLTFNALELTSVTDRAAVVSKTGSTWSDSSFSVLEYDLSVSDSVTISHKGFKGDWDENLYAGWNDAKYSEQHVDHDTLTSQQKNALPAYDTFNLEGFQITAETIASVPEPSSSALFGLAGLTLLARRRR